MIMKISEPDFSGIQRPNQLEGRLAQHKIDEARTLTPEQRLLIALELSDAATALHTRVSTSLH